MQYILTPTDMKILPPTDVQSVCNAIMWGSPLNPNSELTGYEAQFYTPDTEIRVMKTIPQDRTFYILQEGDKLGGPHNTFFRVQMHFGDCLLLISVHAHIIL